MKLYFTISLLLILFGGTVVAQTNNVSAELVAENISPEPGKPFYLGIKLIMNEGWHTYWRNPGDAGLAITIDLKLPDGYKASEILWPYPEKLIESDIVSFIYEDEVYLLTKISPISTKSIPFEISAEVAWLECKVACIPGKANLTMEIVPMRSHAGLEINPLFEEWLNKTPITSHNIKIQAKKNGEIVELDIPKSAFFNEEDLQVEFYPYNEGIYNNAADQKFTKTKNGLKLILELSNLRVAEPSEVQGILITSNSWTNDSNRKALEIKIPIE